MATSMMVREEVAGMAVGPNPPLNREQVELIKKTIAKGATDDELKLFIATANRLRLDPFARQIFAIKRWDPDAGEMGMTTHTSIDGLRLIAERTGEYLPAEDLPEFRYDAKGELAACVVHVLKWRRDGWHKVPAIAFFDEYAQRKKAGGYTKNWAEKPHIMLAKCAESLAIRKAFPNETSGVYIPEEFSDVESETVAPPLPKVAPPAAARRTDGPTVETSAKLEAEARRAAPTKSMRPTPAGDAGPDPRAQKEGGGPPSQGARTPPAAATAPRDDWGTPAEDEPTKPGGEVPESDPAPKDDAAPKPVDEFAIRVMDAQRGDLLALAKEASAISEDREYALDLVGDRIIAMLGAATEDAHRVQIGEAIRELPPRVQQIIRPAYNAAAKRLLPPKANG